MRPRRLLPALLLAALALACGDASRDGGRVLVLGLDGMDPRTVDLLMSEGKLPHFARLRQEEAYGRLPSQEPLLSPIVWTTIATGKGPAEHGIGHFVATGGEGEEIPASSSLRRVKALWNIASQAGRKVAVVGWWATWPPEEVNGAVVSDHTAYPEEAEALFLRALEIYERSHEPDHPDLATLLQSLATLLYRQGELERAEPLYLRALETMEGALGPDHPYTVRFLAGIAEFYRAQGDLERAEHFTRRARESRSESPLPSS